MFITSKNKYSSNDMKIFGTCSVPLNYFNDVFVAAMGKDYNVLLDATRMTNVDKKVITPCWQSTDMLLPCMCRFEICVGWYPCGLKYCHGKDSSGKVVSYRCGIKTCRKCRVFEYYVKLKKTCLWDSGEMINFKQVDKNNANQMNQNL